MIEHYVDSLGLKRGLRVKDYESTDELERAAGEKGACLRIANKYLVEKSSLVDGRDKFAEELEKKTKFGFLMKSVTKKRSDGTVEKVEEIDETEAQYVARFRKAVLSGDFTHQAFPKDEKGLEEALQTFADSLGAFPCDAKRPERQPGRSKIPKWILERVTVIFNNNTQARWWEIMAKENMPIDPLTGERTRDEVALAWAIKERKDRQDKEEQNRYA